MSGYKNSKVKLGIIDLNVNNIFSIYEACKSQGYNTEIINKSLKDYSFDIIIMPGVGSFNTAMKFIKKNNIDEKIDNYLNKKNKLFFGICLGMQLLFEESEEFGVTKGLKLIKGKVKKFKETKNLKVPHIGWNNLTPRINNKNILKMINRNNKYYFVHSYYCVPKEDKIISSLTEYQNIKFCSSITQNNIVATQFHPEKSGEAGLKIIGGMYKYL
tara:strand:+ start:6694 stop:7338 length:645 start_codon:yes stop_codon:yes gene_type:complete